MARQESLFVFLDKQSLFPLAASGEEHTVACHRFPGLPRQVAIHPPGSSRWILYIYPVNRSHHPEILLAFIGRLVIHQ